MKIDLEAYQDKYHQKGKYVDNWQAGISLLPFTSSNASAYNKNCGLHGTTGEFFRLWEDDGTSPITDFKATAVGLVRNYLIDEGQMSEEQVKEFVMMMEDIMLVNGNLNITDSSFLKYLPLVPNDERITEPFRGYYKNGQSKMGLFVYSMLSDSMQYVPHKQSTNLFSKILQEALSSGVRVPRTKPDMKFYILPYIRESFGKDLKWLMEQEEAVKVKYIHLLLYFYACYAVMQTIININQKSRSAQEGPQPLFCILAQETASVSHDAISRGWAHYVPTKSLDRLYGRSQALDIANCVLNGNVGFYADVLERLTETPFEENKALCDELLTRYQTEKRAALLARKSERHIAEDFSEKVFNVQSYEEFLQSLEQLCVELQSPSYTSRMRKKVNDMLGVRLLQNRRRSGYVLALDNEMLTFLIALFTQSNKTKLEDMYRKFNSYGIHFNRESRLAIEEYLLKLNLLDRKSDSGEAQYVTVIL